MRIAFISAVLLIPAFTLAQFCSTVAAQETNSRFQIQQPAFETHENRASEARYYAQLEHEAALRSAKQSLSQVGVTVVSPERGATQQPSPFAGQSQKFNQLPQLNASGMAGFHESPPVPMISVADYHSARLAQQEAIALTAAHRPTAFAQSIRGEALPAYNPPSMFPNFMPFESTKEIRNHNFFGIDRESCCDEWAGFCNCGGLKLNPGHLGLKWLRGDDPCACTQCLQRKRRLKCTNDCGCSDCQREGGLLRKIGTAKKSSCSSCEE